MLTSKNRLTKKKDFDHLKVNGRSAQNTFFRLKYLVNSLPTSRIAVVVSAKISKKAVDRNRLRRQTLEVIRAQIAQLKNHYDILIWVKSKALGQGYQVLEKEILSLFKKSRLL